MKMDIEEFKELSKDYKTLKYNINNQGWEIMCMIPNDKIELILKENNKFNDEQIKNLINGDEVIKANNIKFVLSNNTYISDKDIEKEYKPSNIF